MIGLKLGTWRPSAGEGGFETIAYVGTGSFEHDNAGTIYPPWPAGHAAGDIGILVTQTKNNDIAPPSGWVFVGRAMNTFAPDDSSACQVEVYERVATSSVESAPGIVAVGNITAAQVYVLSGVDPSTPLAHVMLGAGYSDIGETPAITPSITTTADNAMVLHAMGIGRDYNSTGQINGAVNPSLDEIAIYGGNTTAQGSGGGVGLVIGSKTPAGVTGTTSVEIASNGRWAALILALRPAPA